LTKANRKLLQDLNGVVDSQYRVGRVQQQDVLRVQTELSKLLDDERRYVRQREAAVAALNQLRDRPVGEEVPVTRPVTPSEMVSEVARLIELAEAHNPELAKLMHEVERHQEQVELANLGYWPDLEVGFEWNYLDPRGADDPNTGSRSKRPRSEHGTDNWALMFQVNIPIWFDRIEGAKREARHSLTATQFRLRDRRNLVAFRIFDAHSRILTSRDTVELLRSTIIPEAQQAYQVSLTSYQAASEEFITVIDNWRRWLAFELMLHREVTSLETAFAELQREVGVQLISREIGLEGSGSDSDEDEVTP
jgi:outer membrane protein TolC